jgi:LacI family transcriptional regulator
MTSTEKSFRSTRSRRPKAPAPATPGKAAPVRMRDVAAVAGVDTSVVSRVLSGDERLLVRPETRQRVLDTVARLGYRPNVAARMLKTSRAMAIGMVIPDFANVAYAEIARGAEQRASELGYILLLASGRIQDRLPMLQGRVDGLLYAIATSDPSIPMRLPEGMPSLLVNRREPGLGPSVVGNDEASAALATQHLIDLGHRRIAHIVANVAVDTGRRRTAGYARTMNAAGLPVPPELTIETSFDESGGYEATLELLRRDPRPTALFVATARWALGALAACEELGVEVPGDLSIVAFSDIPIARFLHPALTTVQLPLTTMGSRAVDMLLKLIDGEDVEDVMLDDEPQLTVRASTAPPKPERA